MLRIGAAVRTVIAAVLSGVGDIIFAGGGSHAAASFAALQFNNRADNAGLAVPAPGILIVKSAFPARQLLSYHVVCPKGFKAKVDAASTGGGGGGAAGVAGGLNALQRQATGGGADIPTGLADTRGVSASVKEEFRGVNTRAAQATSDPLEAVDAQNVDGVKVLGALSPRAGLIKLWPDRSVVIAATAYITTIPQADFVPDSEYILLTAPTAETHAFWFDTTGADSEPAGSIAADNSYPVDISGATTAEDVATLLITEINTAALGMTAVADDDVAEMIVLTTDTGTWTLGNQWLMSEFVADAAFTVAHFLGGSNAIGSSWSGRSINALPPDFRDEGVDVFALGYDAAGAIGDGAEFSQQAVSRSLAIESLWHGQHDIRGVRPAISLLTNTGGAVTISVVMPQKYRADNAGLSAPRTGRRLASVNELSVLASTSYYPQDPDDIRDDTTILKERDHTTWDGLPETITVDDFESGAVLYVTVWAWNGEHRSLAANFSVTIA